MGIKDDFIICDNCGHKFERDRLYRSCSNCFVCSGCEIYYCPSCDEEIDLIPIKKIGNRAGTEDIENRQDLSCRR
jgi:hypothetical protein